MGQSQSLYVWSLYSQYTFQVIKQTKLALHHQSGPLSLAENSSAPLSTDRDGPDGLGEQILTIFPVPSKSGILQLPCNDIFSQVYALIKDIH